MNELIPTYYDSDHPTVSGRDLHAFLEVSTEYRHWFPRMCEYGFTEGVDFRSKMTESIGGRPATDHRLSIQMGKEISMLQRTERGKLARQHFITIEEAWNQPEAVMARALKMADDTIHNLTGNIKALQAENSQLVSLSSKKGPILAKKNPPVNRKKSAYDWPVGSFHRRS